MKVFFSHSRLAVAVAVLGWCVPATAQVITGQPTIFWHNNEWETYENGQWRPYAAAQPQSSNVEVQAEDQGFEEPVFGPQDPPPIWEPYAIGQTGRFRHRPMHRRRATTLRIHQTAQSGTQSDSLGKPNIGIGQTTIGIGQPNGAIGQTTIGIGQPNTGIGQTTIGIGKPNSAIGQPNVTLGQPTIGIGKPNTGLTTSPEPRSASHSQTQPSSPSQPTDNQSHRH